jgi:mono/diheme cytochrome c family protein
MIAQLVVLVRNLNKENRMNKAYAIMVASAYSALTVQPVLANTDTEKLFKMKCSVCHKMDKEGMGPAVMKMNTDAATLKSAITDGRAAMPQYEGTLDNEKINALVIYLQSKQVALNPCAKNPSGK